ncbi:MAG: NAD(P)-dependent glycerol-3-phosphate dehydrogenase [Deltaproteobacteria bacterium]|nr:NAD(P)-dependent glycerol-3-phosphate dehydrogenase [Deltaproteobacteria bacterium]
MTNQTDINVLKVGVVGAGSWGTAIADLLGSKGLRVELWAFEKEVKDSILTDRENPYYLPSIPLSKNVFPSNDLIEVVSEKEVLIIAVPSHVIRNVAKNMSPAVRRDSIIVSASKGIENETLLTMSDVLRQALAQVREENFVVLSGPSFAREVATRTPTAVTVAGRDPNRSRLVQHLFATPYFRVYTSDDITGVELGGAVKNVIAIAAGIVDGLELGLNTRAALITRGLTEISRLGLKLGANPHTFAGLAGIGDLVLTCTGQLSRNYTVGKQIGAGRPVSAILSEMRMVAEGVKTAKSVYHLSEKLDVEMPICHETYRILYEGLAPQKALQRLMARDLKQEREQW